MAILRAQTENAGKPANIVEKIVAGRAEEILRGGVPPITKVCLGDSKAVGKWLAEDGLALGAFVRVKVGEGIEVQATDRREVAATVADSMMMMNDDHRRAARAEAKCVGVAARHRGGHEDSGKSATRRNCSPRPPPHLRNLHHHRTAVRRTRRTRRRCACTNSLSGWCTRACSTWSTSPSSWRYGVVQLGRLAAPGGREDIREEPLSWFFASPNRSRRNPPGGAADDDGDVLLAGAAHGSEADCGSWTV